MSEKSLFNTVAKNCDKSRFLIVPFVTLSQDTKLREMIREVSNNVSTFNHKFRISYKNIIIALTPVRKR